jgi:hypothetical protein
LDGTITVPLDRLDLGHKTWASLDDRDRDGLSSLTENLGHPDLFA